MHTALFKPFARTFRFRLMVWNAFVVIVTGAVTLLGLREAVRITLIHELDQLLDEDITEIQLSLAEFGDPLSEQLREQLDRKAKGHAQHEWFAQLVHADGSVLCSSSKMSPETQSARLNAGSIPQTIDRWRVVKRSSRTRPDIAILVGSSVALIQQDVARIDRLLTIAIGLVLLTAPACGYWLAGRVTHPLAQIIFRMSSVKPDSLNERLPLRNTGDELDQLSTTFNRLLDRIGAYLQDKRDVLANAAHELRTPLAAIRSNAELALTSTCTPADYQDFLALIMDESARLENLVNQLLLLAETEAERLKLHKQQVRLDELLAKAIDMFGGVSEDRGIQLLCSDLPPIKVEANREHVRQVVLNLLDNAIKFTRAGGQVRVQLESDELAKEAVLRVTDTGVGIPPEDLPHVFDRFFRGDKARRRDTDTRGTGLGLSICRAIIRAHEGTITVDSRVGVGTSVVVRLPLCVNKDEGLANDRTGTTSNQHPSGIHPLPTV